MNRNLYVIKIFYFLHFYKINYYIPLKTTKLNHHKDKDRFNKMQSTDNLMRQSYTDTMKSSFMHSDNVFNAFKTYK